MSSPERMVAAGVVHPPDDRRAETRAIAGAPFGLDATYVRVVSGGVRTARRASDLADDDSIVNVDRISALLMSTSPADPTSSIFNGVMRVPPDSVMTVHADGAIRVEGKARSLAPRSMRAVDAADEIWRRVVAATRKAIGTSKRVAVLAGGGVDSSAVLAAAIAVCRGASNAEVDAIALHFGGEGDDRPYMRELEQELGIVAVKVSPSEAGVHLLPFLESPKVPGWSWSLATDRALLDAARARNAEVALTGFGGDDLFDGQPRALARDFAAGHLDALLLAARLQPSRISALGRMSYYVVRPTVQRHLPASLRAARRRQVNRSDMPWAGPALSSFIDEESERWRPRRIDSPTDRFDALAKATYMADAIELCDWVASQAGVRIAHPFLDEPLVELVCQLPPQLLFQSGRLRGLFRMAARGRVPERVRLRSTKASFLTAWRDALAAAGGVDALRHLASMEHAGRLGLIDPDRFAKAFADLERDDDTWTTLWPILGIEGFLRARAAQKRTC